MLRELENTVQHQGEPFRRLFSDDYFDLYVWFDLEEHILGIQLCYDSQNNGRALTFLRGKYSHEGVDGGESSPLKNLSPILVADGAFPKEMIFRKFKDNSVSLPKVITDYVLGVIVKFPESM